MAELTRIVCLIFFSTTCFVLPSQTRPNTRKAEIWPDRIRRNVKEECSKNITVKGLGGRLTSPGYPHKYPLGADCTWVLTSPRNATILLDLILIALETSTDCQYDYLEIQAAGKVLEHICGKHPRRAIDTGSSSVTIRFHSDASYAEQGFVIDYKTDSLEECQEVVTSESGNVTSPNFPGIYPDDVHCVTKIVGPSDSQCYIRFNVLAMERDDRCAYDYVEVFDGVVSNSTSLGRFCSSAGLHKTLVSHTEVVYVVFHSDNLLGGQGFHLSYSFNNPPASAPNAPVSKPGECPMKQNDYSGTFSSPNYPQRYPGNTKCHVILHAPIETARVQLDLRSLYLEENENCNADFLEIRDGGQQDAPLIGRFCGRRSEDVHVNSSGPSLYVQFESDSFMEFTGFEAKYSYVFNDTSKISLENQPRLEFIKISDDLVLTNGESGVLVCQSTSDGAKNIWFKQSQLLTSDSLPSALKIEEGNLKIESMEGKLAGRYTCVVVAPEGNISHSFWIIPAPEGNCEKDLRRKPRNRTLEERDFTTLECFSPGFSTSWELNGEPVEFSPRHRRLRNGYLSIMDLAGDDTGVYTCQATGPDCSWRVSATLEVLQRKNLSEVCGRPRLGWPTRAKPQMEHGKIIGGEPAKRGQYPWQVMLWDSKFKAFCGGSLLNERWIITAAHCLARTDIDPLKILIKLGRHDQTLTQETHEVVTRVDEIVRHPSYKPRVHDNDIALIRTKDFIHFSDYVMPICLGDVPLEPGPLMGIVTGWGHLTDDGRSLPRFLQALRIPIVPQDMCVKSTSYTVTKSMFCAGYGQEIAGDACKGDSGGPLVMEKENKWYLAGIVSWGEGCGRKGKYGFYTRVSNYLTWVTSLINF